MSHTLHGGKELTVKVYKGAGPDTKQEQWFVRQFRVKEYKGLFPISDDEVALCAKATDKAPEHVGMLTAESYEAVHAAMREVNERGFFIYRRRQLDRANEALRELPAELVIRQQEKLAGTMPLPGGPRRPG